jgi:vacuolar-type H+-ATPase catalytic subunit A/Vma1
MQNFNFIIININNLGTVTIVGAVSPPGGDMSEPVCNATLAIVRIIILIHTYIIISISIIIIHFLHVNLSISISIIISNKYINFLSK